MKSPCDGCHYLWRTRRELQEPKRFCGRFRQDIPPDLVECNAFLPSMYAHGAADFHGAGQYDATIIDPRPKTQAGLYV